MLYIEKFESHDLITNDGLYCSEIQVTIEFYTKQGFLESDIDVYDLDNDTVLRYDTLCQADKDEVNKILERGMDSFRGSLC
jgi:hypothetical protein